MLTKPIGKTTQPIKLQPQVALVLDGFDLRLHCLLSIAQFGTSGIITQADDDVAAVVSRKLRENRAQLPFGGHFIGDFASRHA